MDWFKERMFTPGTVYCVWGGPDFDLRVFTKWADAIQNAERVSAIHKRRFCVYEITTNLNSSVEPMSTNLNNGEK